MIKLEKGDKIVAIKTLIDDNRGEYLTDGNVYDVIDTWGDTFTIIDGLGKHLVFSDYHIEKGHKWNFLTPLKELRDSKIKSLEL